MELNKNFMKKFSRRDFLKASTVIGTVVIVPTTFGMFSPANDKTDLYYNTLADALNKLPNAFPRTKSNIEIQLLKKIFSPEEAWLCGQLTVNYEPIDSIAKRIDLPLEETQGRLQKMSKRGFIWGNEKYARLAPFVVGIYEAQVWDMDHELAHLVEEYFVEGGAEFMRFQPAIHRVIPVQGTTKSEWILPYDDIKAILETNKSFQVRDCICRKQQELLGQRKCDSPMKVCFSFTSYDRDAGENDLTLEEALKLLEDCEEAGLVHSVSNVAEGLFYICNCCGCCCGILRGVNKYGIEKSIAASNYYAMIDNEKCSQCGICVDRCQVHAITEEGGEIIFNINKCIGCGLCVSGCKFDAVKLIIKNDDEIITPPKVFSDWEKKRLENRGI